MPKLATLDGKYELQRCLSDSGRAKVFLAVVGTGKPVIVKFITEPDAFFEEMARHYTCDSDRICQVLYNYPPFSISHQPALLTAEIAELFGESALEEAEWRQSPLARWGALVLEYIDGPPLLSAFDDLDDSEKLRHLRDLALAVRDMHRCGEYHGDLCPENVLLNRDTDSVRLIGLGYSAGKPRRSAVPEDPPRAARDAKRCGLAADVYMFAEFFLSALGSPSPRLRRLIRACMARRPSARPGIELLCRQVARLRPAPSGGFRLARPRVSLLRH